MANSLHQHLSVDEWEFVTALLQRPQILENPQSLASLASEPAFGAFAEMLFREAIYHFVSDGAHQSSTLKAEAWAIIERLVSSGLQFNGVLVDYEGSPSTALGLALQLHEFRLATLLTRARANLNPAPEDLSRSGLGRGPPLHQFIRSLKGRLNSENKAEAFSLLRYMLHSGALLDAPKGSWESALMAAIPVGDSLVVVSISLFVPFRLVFSWRICLLPTPSPCGPFGPLTHCPPLRVCQRAITPPRTAWQSSRRGFISVV